MGIFGKVFGGSKPKAKNTEKPSAALEQEKESTSQETSSHTAVSNEEQRQPEDDASTLFPPANPPTKKAKIVEEYLRCLRTHDREMFDRFLSQDFSFVCTESVLTGPEYRDVHVGLWESFPDFAIRYKSVKERDSDGVVVVEGGVAYGTHTGAPYGFGPYEAVPTSNLRVENDAETFYVHFNQDGKICRFEVVVTGTMTGPPGFYQQIGGFPLL